MGCGSSSLKGDDVPTLNSQPVKTADQAAIQPMKKVNTNFSDVDYAQDSHKRRMTEYAPNETPAPIREQSHDLSAAKAVQTPIGVDDIAPDSNTQVSSGFPREGNGSKARATDGEERSPLKPYRTLGEEDWENTIPPSTQAQPHLNGTSTTNDPTSVMAKDSFAHSNDPAYALNQDPKHLTAAEEIENRPSSEHKKSWLGQRYANLQAAKRGSGPSDEDVRQYTGMDKTELEEWAREKDRVGRNQEAGRAGTDNGLAVGASWTA